jgi:UDP-N-acetyl-D-mannosaminuronic acid transferase (WecB/TagA/CpsF family)
MSTQAQEQQTRESIQHIADRAAAQAVKEVLLHLGIDVANPIQTQIEFQALRELAKLLKDDGIAADLAFARRLRTASETIKDATWRTIIRVVVTAALGIFFIGTRDWWLAHIWNVLK